MRAECSRDSLLNACQLTSAAISSAKEIKPILRNIKAVASAGRCTLMATDTEVGIRLEIQGVEVHAGEDGEAILPAAKLVQILRELKDPKLTIDVDSQTCKIKSKSSKFNLASEDPAHFPDLPNFPEDHYCEISAGTLRDMIRRTIFAVSHESARAVLTGLLWEMDGSTARLVSTDGKRLAMAAGVVTARGTSPTKGPSPVIPTKALGLLERNLAEDPSAPVKMAFRPNEVLFSTERAVVYSRLVDGRFPDYKNVLPKKPSTRIQLPLVEFASAVRQAAIITDNESPRVTFRFATGRLTLSTESAMAGNSEVEVELEKYDGSTIEINFNPNYVIDMLKTLPGDAPLSIDLIDGNSAAIFRSGDDYFYLVMPMS
jgi:DNA polymerase-3 subunit beta